MDCPRCGLVNAPSAQRCDCGYPFVANASPRPTEPGDTPRPQADARKRPFPFTLFVLGSGALALLAVGIFSYPLQTIAGTVVLAFLLWAFGWR